MKDFAGNELEVGQKVICLTAGRSTSWMIWGTVVGFTPQKVKLEIKPSWVSSGQTELVRRDPKNVVIPMTPKRKMTSDEYLASYDYFPGEDFPIWD
jgi:hypothetical protein